MGFHSCAPMSSAPDVHVEENGRRGEYGALPGSLSGGEGQWNENVRISHILCESFRREVPVRVFRNALANSPTFRR